MKFSLPLFFLLTISFFCCKNSTSQAPAQDQTVKTKFIDLDVQQFDKMRVSKDVIVLDVRTPGEVAEGIVDDAVVINVNGNDFDQKIKELDKSKTYLVYCKAGGRSVKACNKMSEQGFSTLYNLKGGYTAWTKTNQ